MYSNGYLTKIISIPNKYYQDIKFNISTINIFKRIYNKSLPKKISLIVNQQYILLNYK